MLQQVADPKQPDPITVQRANIAATEKDEERTEAHVRARRPLTSPHE